MLKRVVVVASLLIGLCILYRIAFGADKYHTYARRAWKDTALAELHGELTSARIEALNTSNDFSETTWIGNSVLRFRNGDWIAYRSCTHKEFPMIYDFFLGRGSDGKWYYSTFHFCRDMCVLSMEGPCSDLETFKTAHALQAFDGESDVCLQPTWPTPLR